MLAWLATVVTLIAVLGGLAEAGEIVFKNGTRISADLAQEALMVSTGSDLVEVSAAQVAVLTADEIQTRDGRTIRGTVVGGTLRARTTYGELTVALQDLAVFRADPPAAATTPATGSPDATPPATVAGAAQGAPAASSETPSGPTQVAQGADTIRRGAWETTMDIGRTVTGGVDRIHDGFTAMGRAIREGLFSVARAARRAFTD